MCEVDWSALGTWAAVVVALGISVAGGVRTRLRERVQATILATSLHVEVQQCVAYARALVQELDDDETGMRGLLFRVNFPDALVRCCSAFPTEHLDSAASRIHVLPLACSRPLVDMRASIALVRLFGESVHTLSDSRDPEQVRAALEAVRIVAAKLLTSAELAAEQVENVANRTPRWWQSIIG